jgi:lysophospholipase L1-like esterase
MKTMIPLLAMLACASAAAGAAAEPPKKTGPNLALHKPFESSDPNPNHRDWNSGLTDGSWTAVRGSTYATGPDAAFPKTVTIDLEKKQEVAAVLLGVPPFGATKTVAVSISENGGSFTGVGSHDFAPKTEARHLFRFKPAQARYVRLTFAGNHESQDRFGSKYCFITEVEVFGGGAAAGPERPGPADDANATTRPAPRDAKWMKRHEGFVETAQKETGCQVLFLGDSITDYWRDRGRKTWDENYAPLHAVNLGISGDRTQHLLWRLQNGGIGALRPKAVVMMIGTNNTGFERDRKTLRNTPEEIAAGVAALVGHLRAKLPDAKILLLAVFPRGGKDTMARAQVHEVNTLIAPLHDGKNVFYLDIGPKFLAPDGAIPRDIMPDLLHPGAQGYKIWADAIREPLAELLK